MEYTIIEERGLQTLIEVEHNGETYRSIVICNNKEEFSDAAQVFVNTIKNPRDFPPPEPAPNYEKMIAELKAEFDAYKATHP